ncbi:MAG: hypothetical protein KY468_10740 [Armatimonadetes bacterium]|nr:hypothetical protein [Armatimonadota bacterium]
MDQSQLSLSIFSFVLFSLGSGVIAGYVAGRLEELGRYALSVVTMGLGFFFLLLLMYTVYLRMFARMPLSWIGPLMWTIYPCMVGAVILGWYVAQKRNDTTQVGSSPVSPRPTERLYR